MVKRFLYTIVFLLGAMFFSLSSPVFAQVTYVENFDDPLGGWTTRWFYQNTNAENYYVAQGTCDPNYRGNEPNGIWISDDRGCSNLILQNPVRINFLNNFGNSATAFSIDVRACASNTTLSIYDQNGQLVQTDNLFASCILENHSYTLTNGISAFEFNATAQIEGNTAIDNVTITTQQVRAVPVPTLTEWGMIIFMAFAGIGSVYYMRRQRRTEN